MLFARIRLAMSTETVDCISGVTFEINFHVSRLIAKRNAGSDPRHLARNRTADFFSAVHCTVVSAYYRERRTAPAL